MEDILEDRKSRILIFFFLGWLFFLIAEIMLGNADNYGQSMFFGVILLAFILFMAVGFFWILAMVLNLKVKYPRKSAKTILQRQENPKPTIPERPVIVERRIVIEPPKKILEAPKIAENELRDYFIGSKELDKYHIYTCKWVKIIKPENRIYFKTKEQAEGSGYKLCKTCKNKKLG